MTAVAKAILRNPDAKHYSYELAKQARIRSGAIYRIVWAWHTNGWLADGWDPPPTNGRPPRRYYTLTEAGRRELERLVPPPPLHPTRRDLDRMEGP